MKKIFLSVLFISTYVCVPAEELSQSGNADTAVIIKHVQIEKEFIPEIEKVKRTNLSFSVTEPEIKKVDVNYSDSTKQIETTSDFHPLSAANLSIMERARYKKGYVRGGIGFPLTWLVDFWYPIWDNKTYYLDVHANHYGINSSVQKLINTDVGVNFSKNFKKDQLYASVNFKNSYYSYYGTDSVNNTNLFFYDVNNQKVRGDSLIPFYQSLIEAEAMLGYRSVQARQGWRYDANLAYHLMSSYFSQEHEVSVFGTFSKELGGFPLSVDLNVNSFFYNTSNFPFITDTTANWQPQAVIALAPRYEMQWDNLKLRVGAKMNFSINKGQLFTASPDIELGYNFRTLFNVYAGIGGDYDINNMAKVFNENRYFCPTEQLKENTYTPFDFYGGFKIKPVTGLMIDAAVSYKMIANQYFFFNKPYDCITTPNLWPLSASETVYGNVFTAEFLKSTLLNVSLDISYNLKERFMFYAKGMYNGWNVMEGDGIAWNKPAWEATAGIDAKVTENLLLKGMFYFGSERLTKLPNRDGSYRIAKMSPIYDLNLAASYTFKKNWSLFVQANNILSVAEKLHYQHWYGYETVGFTVLLGASLAF